MAIYHASTSAVSRGNGYSTTAKAAYISCDKITDEITGEIHNYENKNGLEHSDIVLPDGIDKKISPSELWNKAELAEGRKDSRVGREWVVGLPHELNKEQRLNLVQSLSKELANRYQVGTQYFVEKKPVQVKQENVEEQKAKQDILLQSILAKHKDVDKIVEQYKQSEQQKKVQQQKEREKTFVQEISRSKSRGFER